MTRRRVTTGVTLVVLAVVLCVMAVWGYRAATAPLPSAGSSASSTSPGCASADQKVVKYLSRGDVTVSVFNAGQRQGRAQSTMDLLERAGFKAGEVNNAPKGTEVEKAAVYTTKADDPAAELVARALGPDTQVVHTEDTLGPGVYVMVGDKFRQLDPKAPKRLKLKTPEITCQ